MHTEMIRIICSTILITLSAVGATPSCGGHISSCSRDAPIHWHNYSSNSRLAYEKGINYLKCLQSHFNRSSMHYLKKPEKGGGFGALFQRAASEFYNYIIRSEYSDFPVQILGTFSYYTRNEFCNTSLSVGLLNCFFEDMVVNHSDRPTAPDHGKKCQEYDPGFVYRGSNWDTGWWWALIQSYLFRPNDFLLHTFTIKTGNTADKIYDLSIHIRIGGKIERPTEFKKKGYKFETETYLDAATSIMKRCALGRKFQVYIASDSPEARPYIENWAKLNKDSVSMTMQPPGFSQKNAAGGKEAFTNFDRGEEVDRLNLSLEILTDIWYLSRSRVFIGMEMSSLARLVIALGKSRGIMSAGIAMDLNKNTKTDSENGWGPSFLSLDDTSADVCSR